MARDWVKLHTSMLGHVGTMRLSDPAFRLWIVLLMLAGTTDDEGRAGTCDDVTYYLRWTDDQLRNALRELNGRAVETGGFIVVRDWADWQPKIDPTNAERQARFRANRVAEAAKAAASAPPCTVTDGNAVTVTASNEGSNAPTRGRELSRTHIEPEEPEEDQLTGDAPAPPAGSTPRTTLVARNGYLSRASLDWSPFYERCGALWAQSAYRESGQVYAWVGQMAHVVGCFASNMDEALRLLQRWADSPDFRFAQSPQAAPPKFGKWLTASSVYDAAVRR